MGCALNADVPLPRGDPPRPVLPVPNAPPGVDPRLGVLKPVVPSPVAPKVLVPSGVPNVEPAVRPVPPSPDVVPKAAPRDDAPTVPRMPIGFA